MICSNMARREVFELSLFEPDIDEEGPETVGSRNTTEEPDPWRDPEADDEEDEEDDDDEW